MNEIINYFSNLDQVAAMALGGNIFVKVECEICVYHWLLPNSWDNASEVLAYPEKGLLTSVAEVDFVKAKEWR